MPRLLLIGIIPVAITLIIIFFLARPKIDLPKQMGDAAESLTSSESEPTTSYDDLLNEDTNLTRAEFLQILEASISATDARIDTLAAKQGISVPKVTVPTPTPTAIQLQSTTSGPRVAYIPLGSSGSSSSLNVYENITNTEVIIDTANYPGYKNMYLEAQIRIFQGNGQGAGRLFNKTDGLSINNSDISTTSETFGLQSSNGFKVTSGKKNYLIQLKSNTGYSVDLQTSRIRVEF